MSFTPNTQERHQEHHRRSLAELLAFLYGTQVAAGVLPRLLEQLERFRREHPLEPVPPAARLHQRDAIAITYGDQVTTPGEAPLVTLRRFLGGPLAGTVTGVHLLPFFPYSSDDGFSVIDYFEVDPALGNWADVEAIAATHRLMVDAVINHVSAHSRWFQAFVAGDERYRDYFLTVPPDTDLSAVVRPRTSPLLTPVETADGTKYVWTTFSSDQIDLNYANPEVLLEIVRVLLHYVAHGAEIIRLDAVTYLWKEVGTPCVHHPKTHGVVKLLRSVLEVAALRVVLLTETNVPHAENISYFGNGHDEAQMVYNFALPPLVLHTFLAEDARALQRWASDLAAPSDETAFFNFLASHDGIGVRPVEGLLDDEARQRLVAATLERGGRVSYKTNSDSSQSPYELNISYFDALSDPHSDEPLAWQVRRFLSAHAIMLALAGVPGIYIHSLLGSRSAPEEVARTGQPRSINRKKFLLDELQRELADPAHRRSQVLGGFRTLLAVRTQRPEFHPQAPQQILATPPGVFGVLRGERLACLHNVTTKAQRLEPSALPGRPQRDLLRPEAPPATADGLTLAPLETRWLELS